MGLLSSLFGNKEKKQDQIIDMIERGGIMIDVRTPQEFKSGHVKGSKNIPGNRIDQEIKAIKKLNKPVILCCASGARSGMATNKLKSAGIEAVNGGSWRSLN